MDIGAVMNTMRDPAGVPAPPWLFQVLMVFTWVVHISFVQVMLGTAGLAAYGFYNRTKSPYWKRLSIATTKVALVSISLLIVFGVAPLLFVQVIYDPQWYTSNVLSGRWVVAFIFTLLVGYCLWYAFYYANHEDAKPRAGAYALIALAIFCLDGLIMHALAYQAILPKRWMDWYAPNGVVDTSGSALHAIQWPRYLFIMSLSIPTAGLFLTAYAQYYQKRADLDVQYRMFARQLGVRLAVWGFGLALPLLLIWQLCQPRGSGLAGHPVGWLLVAALVAMMLWCNRLKDNTRGYVPPLGGLGVLALLGIWREIVRVHLLSPLGYSIDSYPVHHDWPSMMLFFLTFVGIGGLVGGFYLTVLYRAGNVLGLYVAEKRVARLGTAAVAVLVLWIAAFFIYGIVIWLHNSLAA